MIDQNRIMERVSGSGTNGKGYAWAVSAGFNAALAAISVKLPLQQFLRYGMVLLFNVTMWACYVNSLKALSSLQATVTNFATNFISSGLAGFFFFRESLSFQWFAGAILIIIGVVILSNSSIEEKFSTD
ncbi:uncharacterized protein LOC106767489 isoform X1 [Vigna radiata var. radiata]|uniref:Uncharacterized protein LOC106767489 isoform X1 n=2 Tax=Vigna radiata var. radiata TaxID=3916 RepID=A0A1S3UP81_VIGRR|nr:uncharacterized protein LOC106767489 isoform X1 [Vigna radiata var. radiata]